MYPNFYKHTASLIGLVVIATVAIGAAGATPRQESATLKSVATSDKILERKVQELKLIKKEEAKPKYTAKSRLKPQELKSLLEDVGFRGQALKLAWATAMKESTGRPMAHNKNSNTGDNSYGLFQINMIGSLGPARLEQYGLKSNEDLFDPLTNAKIAFQMSNGGKNWSAWNGIGERTKEWMKEFPN